MPPIYPSSCKSIEEVQISTDLLPGSVGLANSFTYRYQFKPVTLLGLNRLDIILVYGRPTGQGSLSHILMSGQRGTELPPCKKGKFHITGGTLGGKFSTDDAYLFLTDGRITLEHWVFIDQVAFLFFNYTTAA